MRSAPRVSVIVPCYNVADRVRDTLSSVLDQTHPEWELILVDDGSNDGTTAVLDSLVAVEPRAFAVRQRNQGLAGARNTGLAIARSDRILFLDAGDTLMPEALATLNDLLDAHPDSGAAFGGYKMVGPQGEQSDWTEAPAKMELAFPDFVRTNPVSTDSLLFQRSWLEQAGSFDTDMPACEDWDLWSRVGRCGCEYVGTPSIVSSYHMSPNSMSRRVSRMLEAGWAVLERNHGPDERCLHADPRYFHGQDVEDLPDALTDWCTYCLAVAFAQSGMDGSDRLLRQIGTRLKTLDPRRTAVHLYVAIPYARCVFPDQWPLLWQSLQGEIRRWLKQMRQHHAGSDFVETTERLLCELIQGRRVLARLTRAVLDRAVSLERLILYGNGRNGRALRSNLQNALECEIAIADDSDPRAPIDTFFPVSDDTLIVVTPWNGEAMCRRLRAAGAIPGNHFIAWTDFVTNPADKPEAVSA